MTSYHAMKTTACLTHLGVKIGGLSDDEAKKRLEQYGQNILSLEKHTSPLRIFFSQFNSPIILILIVATIISSLVGEWVDAIAILSILILNAVMGFLQEFKAEKAIEALQKLVAQTTRVMRAHEKKVIDSKDVVPGDIIFLEEGDKVPADARLLEATELRVQESALTGESDAVRKTVSIVKETAQLGDRINMVFSGTNIVSGKGVAVIVSTGMQTEVGKIAKLVTSQKEKHTPLQLKLASLGKFLALLTIVISVIIFIVGLLKGGSLVQMFLTAVSLSVAAVPEGLPIVITIALAFGIQKMVKKNALMRRLSSVETLGSVTVICTDKTGTLTKNEMTVVKAWTNNKVVSLKNDKEIAKAKRYLHKELLAASMHCNDASVYEEEGEIKKTGDPTESALLLLCHRIGLFTGVADKLKRVDELPFNSRDKRMATIHKIKNKKVSYVKGAPDVILEHCTKISVNGKVSKLTPKRKKELLSVVHKFSEQSLRVLGFAYNDKVKSKNDYAQKLIFTGLLAMMDPPRSEVAESIAKSKRAGIKVIMITGDHLGTAVAIGRQLGIEGSALEAKDLDKVDLDKVIEDIGIYARVNPEDKLKIVHALQQKGHIVAMTGDGVNDAPALKKADIGIAMGISGTDVAKEASDMLLLDDNFSSIVNAIEEGRGIYDNMKKFVNYLLSSNFSEVLVLFVAMLIGFMYNGVLVLPLLAIHLLWINLITDGFPALALGVDPIDKGIMNRKPRDPKEHIITRNMLYNIIAIGILLTAATLYLFSVGLAHSPEKAWTMAVTTLVVLEIVRLMMIRDQYHTAMLSNKYLNYSILLILALQLLLIYTPIGNLIFKLTPLTIFEWGHIVIVSAGIFGIGKFVSEYVKHLTNQQD
ncbi:MAG: calcium-translocating P-type ATPase, SERCA-type [Candidatus Woesearchaeota archaeon]|nr:MAG: calcium-translocating P-type ATPase, SERCA-type [Candidatus Woesearchaeota archaeon]